MHRGMACFVVSILLSACGCADAGRSEPASGAAVSAASGSASGAGSSGGAGPGGAGSGGAAGGGATAGAGGAGGCEPGPASDADGDGLSIEEGDCNDCDPLVGPHVAELTGVVPSIDDDCDGDVDEVSPPCDAAFPIDDPDPVHAARALDVCTTAAANGWGLVEAKWVNASGAVSAATKQVGLLGTFGAALPRRGERMVGLSTGHARAAGDPDECLYVCQAQNGSVNAPPMHFPQPVAGCPSALGISDDAGLELTLAPPKNAKGVRFLFSFYSMDFPWSLCREYDDQFVALVSPEPAGSYHGNVALGPDGGPIAATSPFLEVCDPATIGMYAMNCSAGGWPTCPTAPEPYCALGPAELAGTGFDDCAAAPDDAEPFGGTGWLATTLPVDTSADVTMRFAIWDGFDWFYDSTVLLDSIEWLGGDVTLVTERR